MNWEQRSILRAVRNGLYGCLDVNSVDVRALINQGLLVQNHMGQIGLTSIGDHALDAENDNARENSQMAYYYRR